MPPQSDRSEIGRARVFRAALACSPTGASTRRFSGGGQRLSRLFFGAAAAPPLGAGEPLAAKLFGAYAAPRRCCAWERTWYGLSGGA